MESTETRRERVTFDQPSSLRQAAHGGPASPDRRRFLAGSGMLAASAFLTACGARPEGEAVTGETADPGSLGTPKDQRYVWVTGNLADPFYQDGREGMMEFGRLFGVEVDIVGPQDSNAAEMAKTFETVVNQPGVSGIFSYYYEDFNAVETLYQEANEKGIPVVNGAGDWGGPRLSFCGVRDEDAPSAAIDVIAEALGSEGTVGFIGNTGVNLVREEQFFREFVAERYPNLNYVGNATHDGSANDAVAQYQAYVGANPELDAVFFGDGLGPSIADALVDAKPEIKLVLRGFGQNGLDAIKAGAVLAAVDRSPFDEEFWGFMPLYFAVNGGYRAPDTMIVPTFAVDASNIEAFIEAPYRDATQWAAS